MGAVMSQTREEARTPVWMLWTGRIVSALPVLIVLMSARMKLTSDPWYVQEWGRIGWQVGALPLIASLQLAAMALYVIPQTSMLGAVLLGTTLDQLGLSAAEAGLVLAAVVAGAVTASS